MPQGGYTETIAFAREAHLSADQLLTVARIAAGTVKATEHPLYIIPMISRRSITAIAEAIEENEAMDRDRAGRKREADELATEVLVAVDKLKEAVEASMARLR
ncbi:hypothetical protein [Kitasatospora sp. MY 5-36]|uniref:hypothetical protein n=1 Tax=Kitasatospora sp. MY 5-36 TaxID=1678027 RepID=UPI000670A786|nr:hypothetical protein [Kitasatospora sp. MY 5-36]